jgi:hypothetical protein
MLASSSYYALGQTTITGAATNQQKTSKTGNLTISSTGSVTVGIDSAVKVDSNNSVDNQGAITIDNANGTAAIEVLGGTSGTIMNSGTITNSESSPPTSPPLATGHNRYGIKFTGNSAFTGKVMNAPGGSITVLGNDSAGIGVMNDGGIKGAIISDGSISITGDGSNGIYTGPNSTISKGIAIKGSITAVGQTTNAVALNGVLGARLYIDAILSATGFYNGGATTARPTNLTSVTVANQQFGGSAVFIGNTVSGGVLVDTAGQVISYGPAPGMQIIPLNGVAATIGAPKGTGTYGLDISGDVEGNGIYDTFSATALQIGSSNTTTTTGTVTIQNGMDVAGKVTATSYAANATAISIGSGATVPAIVNTGTISATVNYGANANATVGGDARAIADTGGSLSLVKNLGTISATTASGNAYALDLSGDTVAVTLDQFASKTTTASAIIGNIRFGDAGAQFNLNSGTVSGALEFGGTQANTFNINKGALYNGQMSVDAGGSLTLNINDGRLASTNSAATTLNALKIGSQGELDFAISPGTGNDATYAVIGKVSIASGAKLGLLFDSQLTAPESFTLITANTAGALVGQTSAILGNVPYFYVANINTNTTTGTISVDVRDRTFAEAGVLGSASAYNAVFANSYVDTQIRDAFNAAGSQPAFKNVYQQMLPSYSGGLFELMLQGTNAVAMSEAANPLEQSGMHGGAWAQQVGFGNEQGTRSSPGFHGGGLGFAFGWEAPIDTISAWGVTVSYIRGASDDFNTGPDNQEIGTVYGAGVYWRENDGQFRTEASVNGGFAQMNSSRNFSADDLNGMAVTRTASAEWSGAVAHARVAVSFEQPLGDDYYIKPLLMGDYFLMYSGAHGEKNGGPGFDLSMASTTGTQGSITGGVAVGTKWGDKFFLWRPELMVGYKEVFGGPDDVSAHFAQGSAFILTPASQKSGPVAHVGIHGGNKYSDIAVEAGGEDRDAYTSFDGRVVARFRF